MCNHGSGVKPDSLKKNYQIVFKECRKTSLLGTVSFIGDQVNDLTTYLVVDIVDIFDLVEVQKDKDKDRLQYIQSDLSQLKMKIKEANKFFNLATASAATTTEGCKEVAKSKSDIADCDSFQQNLTLARSSTGIAEQEDVTKVNTSITKTQVELSNYITGEFSTSFRQLNATYVGKLNNISKTVGRDISTLTIAFVPLFQVRKTCYGVHVGLHICLHIRLLAPLSL